jgi:FSR family fosmidomycin resistance protein-like MFS transporter
MTSKEASFLRDKTYISVSLDHFFVDVLNSSRALVVAIIAVNIGLSNAQVGLVLLLYNMGSALSQPFFGLLADRYGSKWPILGGVGWMVAMYTLATLTGDWTALVLLTIAGLGSGAFHPAGTKYAGEASEQAETQATGVFFAAGQSGLFAGPVLAGLLLDSFDRPGYLILPALAGTALVIGWRWSSKYSNIAHRDLESRTKSSDDVKQGNRPSNFRRTLVALMIIIIATSTVSSATINLGSKLFTEQGYSAFYIGLISGSYMLGAAVGGIIGATLGDRHGRRLPILIGVLGAAVPFFVYIGASDIMRPAMLLTAGFFGGMPHSVLVIAAQSLIPGRRAFASGLALGMMFFSGAIGTLVLGIIADEIGLAVALRNASFILLLAAFAALILPNRAVVKAR